jgi:hypothetical protein
VVQDSKLQLGEGDTRALGLIECWFRREMIKYSTD